MNPNISGMIFDIKEFAVHDGPGIRTTVFLKGCPLDCSWCHNPEGKSADPQIMRSPAGDREAGRLISAAELASRLNRQAEILRANEGGVTFSGGEPLQQAAFVACVIDQLDRLHVLLDTSGFGDQDDFRALVARSQLVYFDLKLIDEDLHRRYTGRGNQPILKNLELLSQMNVPYVVRVPLIPGVTDTLSNLSAIASILSRLPTQPSVELLPYNPLAGAKYASLGLEYSPGFTPNSKVETHLEIFANYGLQVNVRRSAGELILEP
jgi:pyruvate formate lyase activating enzyme